MPFPIPLNQEQYEALVALARKGAENETEARLLESFLVDLETSAGITRHTLWVQWQELYQPLPPRTDFPKVYPPELRHRINLISRPIARADVDAVIKEKAKQPFNVLVTPDPAAVVGWTKVDDYFIR